MITIPSEIRKAQENDGLIYLFNIPECVTWNASELLELEVNAKHKRQRILEKHRK